MLVGFISLFVVAAFGLQLEDVYGRVSETLAMEPKMPRTRRRQHELCEAFPLRIALIQDLTSSFGDDLVQMRSVQLPLMQAKLSESHPDSEVAVVTFRDKPIAPLGIPPSNDNGGYADYCVKIEASLNPIQNGTAVEAYSKLRANGGGDGPENAYGAMVAAAQSSLIHWNHAGTEACNLVVVITDAAPHFEGDDNNAAGLPAFSGTFDESNPDKQCTTEYYPSPLQVASAIRALNAYVAFVVYDPEDMQGLVGRSWQWMNRYINQTDDFITLQAEDSSNFWENLGQIIEAMEHIECELSTPPPSPTRSIPTDVAAITHDPTAVSEDASEMSSSAVLADSSRASLSVAVQTSAATLANPSGSQSSEAESTLTSSDSVEEPMDSVTADGGIQTTMSGGVTREENCRYPDDMCPWSIKLEKDGVIFKANHPLESFQMIVNGVEVEI